MKRPVVIIEELGVGARGIAHLNGQVVFVDYVLPGEEVQISIIHEKKNYLEGCLEEVLKPSPERIAPQCQYFGTCGGCQLQHWPYEKQLAWKEGLLRTLLQNHLGEELPSISVWAAPSPWHYRDRIQLHINEQGKAGFFRPRSHEVIAIESCPISHPHINQYLQEISVTPPPRERWGQTQEIRVATVGKKITIKELQRHEAPFQQAYGEQCEKMGWWLERTIPPSSFIAELYCGAGTWSSYLAPSAKKIWCFDQHREAVEQAIAAAEREHWRHMMVWQSTAQAGLETLRQRHQTPDVILMDPPRSGAKECLALIGKLAPQHIIYISCDVMTLIRDLKGLVGAGYEIKQLVLVDMFPQTAHLEVMVHLIKKS